MDEFISISSIANHTGSALIKNSAKQSNDFRLEALDAKEERKNGKTKKKKRKKKRSEYVKSF